MKGDHPFVRPDQEPDRVIKLSITQLFDAVSEYVIAHRLLPFGEARCLLTVHRESGDVTLECWKLPLAVAVKP